MDRRQSCAGEEGLKLGFGRCRTWPHGPFLGIRLVSILRIWGLFSYCIKLLLPEANLETKISMPVIYVIPRTPVGRWEERQGGMWSDKWATWPGAHWASVSPL